MSDEAGGSGPPAPDDGAPDDGAPIVVGLHHGAVNVSDWDRSLAFYRDLLGLRLLGSGVAEGEPMSRALGFPRARLRWAMFAVGEWGHLELIQYLEPPPGRSAAARHDAAVTHLAFRVRDLETAHARLVARGVPFVGPPVRFDEPVPVGGAFAYALDPDGVLIEIIEDVAERDAPSRR